MLKERERFVRTAFALLDVWIAWLAFQISVSIYLKQFSFLVTRDSVVITFFIAIYWYALSRLLHLNDIYRSRPLGIVLFNCILQGLVGSLLLAITLMWFSYYFRAVGMYLMFTVLSIVLIFSLKTLIYRIFKYFRKKGLNSRNVLFVGDHTSVGLLRLLHDRFEWGYRIVGVVGDEEIRKMFQSEVPVYDSEKTQLDRLITAKTIDEVIYAREYEDIREVRVLMDSCHEVGVTFRLYSPFVNKIATHAHLHYYDTHAVLTVSNTPNDFIGLKIKRLVDIAASGLGILILSPVFVVIALLVKLGSKGPILFNQQRVGLRGRKFNVHKFRTMVVNAEDLKDELMEQNEMNGPVFKMTNDPRITSVGRFLRKTSLDELPQFFNVLFGDMSIVGPRPPVPLEVAAYERWQLRRLSMRPGITCLWQIAPSRNDISFEDWMRMDMEYIDNWTLGLDFVIILKTIRTVFRADGK